MEIIKAEQNLNQSIKSMIIDDKDEIPGAIIHNSPCFTGEIMEICGSVDLEKIDFNNNLNKEFEKDKKDLRINEIIY